MKKSPTTILALIAGALLLALAAITLTSRGSAPAIEGADSTLAAVPATTQAPAATLPPADERTSPLPADLAALRPSLETLSENTGSGGMYEVTREQEIPADTPVFEWAEGLNLGHETVYTFQSANSEDMMKHHDARAVLRALVFATPEDAARSMANYQRKMGAAVIKTGVTDGIPYSILTYEITGDEFPLVDECMRRDGALIVWALYQDAANAPVSWGETACLNAKAYRAAIAERYPSLRS